METHKIAIKTGQLLLEFTKNPVVAVERDGRMILQRIAVQDRKAASECLDCYGDLIWHLVRKHTSGAKEAERAVCEIFQDIWKDAANFDAGIHDERSFIALIALRRLLKTRLNRGSLND